jgi:Macrocin-O-methyltransferase (TylF)
LDERICATWYRDRFDVLTVASIEAPADGLVLEFGVASGATINHLARAHAMRGRRIHGFDSFLGLPESWSSYPAGHFACEPPAVEPNVGLVIGLFAQTIPAFLAEHAGSAALIHIDCDLYSSTKTVLDLMGPRIVAGTIIVMDEYWIVPDHEQRAFEEWLFVHGRKCRHLCRSIEQACVIME